MSPRTVTGPTDRVVVVGAGFAGLATALHLAGAGRTVTVVEQALGAGGKACAVETDGYTFDAGPTVLTMPDLIHEAFASVGEDPADWVDLIRVDPAYRAHYADGSQLDVPADPEAMAAGIGQLCGHREAEGFRRFIAFLRKLYACEFEHFIDRNINGPPRWAPSAPWTPRSGSTCATRAPSACSPSRRCTPASLRTRHAPCTRSSRTWTPSPASTSPAVA